MKKALVVLFAITLVGASQQAAQAKSKYTVTISASKSTIELGKGSVKLTGKVSPSAKGKKVSIQRKYGNGAWKTIATAKLSSSSKYAINIKPKKAAITSYRVVKPRTKMRSAGASVATEVRVGRWRYVVDLPRTDYVAAEESTATIRGIRYPKSIRLTTGGSVSYRTDHLCHKITTFAGMDDQSANDAAATLYLYSMTGSGGLAIFSETVENLGYPVFFNSISDQAFTEEFTFDAYSVPVNSVATFGTPKVYCFS